MTHSIQTMMLFTLSACPTGRSIGTVLREVKESQPSIEFKTVYVDVEAEQTNAYRIKKNPTTLFLDEKGKEIFRLEGLQETEQVLQLIKQINAGEVISEIPVEENRASNEEYTVYFLKQDRLHPVTIQYENKTSVRAPRITALKLQLAQCPEGFANPFPPSSELELVQFKEGVGTLTISMKAADAAAADHELMELALAKTLTHFGVESAKLQIQHRPA